MPRNLKFPAMLRLQDFAGTNRVRRHGHRAADFRCRKTGRQLQRLRKQAVAKQHRDFVPPIRRQGELTTADFGLVHHVVMDQRGQMDHFNDDRRVDMCVTGFADGIGRQGDQGRAQMFAAAIEGILRVGNDLRVKIVDLLDQSLRDRLEKWLQRFHDMFPGTVRVGFERVSRFCSRHL